MGDLVSETTITEDSFTSALEKTLTEEELKLSDGELIKSSDEQEDEQNPAHMSSITNGDGELDITQNSQQPFDVDTPCINSQPPLNNSAMENVGIEIPPPEEGGLESTTSVHNIDNDSGVEETVSKLSLTPNKGLKNLTNHSLAHAKRDTPLLNRTCLLYTSPSPRDS